MSRPVKQMSAVFCFLILVWWVQLLGHNPSWMSKDKIVLQSFNKDIGVWNDQCHYILDILTYSILWLQIPPMEWHSTSWFPFHMQLESKARSLQSVYRHTLGLSTCRCLLILTNKQPKAKIELYRFYSTVSQTVSYKL